MGIKALALRQRHQCISISIKSSATVSRHQHQGVIGIKASASRHGLQGISFKASASRHQLQGIGIKALASRYRHQDKSSRHWHQDIGIKELASMHLHQGIMASASKHWHQGISASSALQEAVYHKCLLFQYSHSK